MNGNGLINLWTNGGKLKDIDWHTYIYISLPLDIAQYLNGAIEAVVFHKTTFHMINFLMCFDGFYLINLMLHTMLQQDNEISVKNSVELM